MQRTLLENRSQLIEMLNLFYARVREDTLIGPIFVEVAKVDWDEHLPKIYNFWDSLLFGSNNYIGRPFPPHIPLNLERVHFERWLKLFFITVDEKFFGLKADEIKARALRIGHNFLGNIERLSRQTSMD